jgi:hypothetical protein
MSKSIISTKSNTLAWLPWTLTGVVSAIAIGVWGNSFGWQAQAINAYQFFPVLGLLGFSIMWSHYMAGEMKRTFLKTDLTDYFRITGYAVLIAILLHPGILIYQRFRDGFGLPSGSYATYVAPGMAWITLLGTVSLMVFLAYELKRFFGEKRWWVYLAGLGDIAMLAIFYHGLRLGSQLQGGWFRSIWILYGLTLVIAICHKYFALYQTRESILPL